MDLAYLLVDEPEPMQRTLKAIERVNDDIYRHIAAGPPSYPNFRSQKKRKIFF